MCDSAEFQTVMLLTVTIYASGVCGEFVTRLDVTTGSTTYLLKGNAAKWGSALIFIIKQSSFVNLDIRRRQSESVPCHTFRS